MNTAPPSAARVRRADGAAWTYALAALLAVGLHGWWWFESAVPWQADREARPVRPAPRLTFLAPADGDAEQPVRDAWSPALFALPSPAGFSPRADRPSLSPRSGLRPAAEERALLGPAARKDEAEASFLRSLADTVAAVSNRLDLAVEDPAFPPAVAYTGFALRVQWVDGPPRLQGAGLGARELAPWMDQRPWQATAALQFDAMGIVQSVILEETTPVRERNEALARALRKLRIAPGSAGAAPSRVQVSYEQGAPSAAQGASP